MTGRSPRFEILEQFAKVSRKIRTQFDSRVREKGLTLARARTLSGGVCWGRPVVPQQLCCAGAQFL